LFADGAEQPSVIGVPPVTVPVYSPSQNASCSIELSVSVLLADAVYSPVVPPVWS
jgi:hypothetical protein